jgi:TIR domain
MAQGIRVFLSYKREDYSIAQTFREQIRNVTDRCHFFVDIETIEAFDNWEERIESQLKVCDYFILLYTVALH